MEQNAVGTVYRFRGEGEFYTKILHKYSNSFQLQGSESELTN